jgi:hypothetical protein
MNDDVEWLVFLLLIRGVLASNVGSETDYPNLSLFFSVQVYVKSDHNLFLLQFTFHTAFYRYIQSVLKMKIWKCRYTS